MKQIKVKIEATLPLPETQPQEKSPCSAGCGGTCGKDGGNAMKQVAEILLKLAGGQYTPGQAEGVQDVIEALLRRHYSRQP